MDYNYIEIISNKYPDLEVSCVGSSFYYPNIDWGTNTPIPQATLDSVALEVEQAEVWAKIKDKRDYTKYDGVLIKSINRWIHSDDASRIQQIGLVMMGANMPTGLMWKLLDNNYVEMTPALAQEIFQTVCASDSAIFSVAESHRQNMLKLSDPDSYNFSGGWPMTYSDFLASQTTPA